MPFDEDAFYATYLAVPASASAARSAATQALRKWGIDGLIDDMALVTSELVTNAVRITMQYAPAEPIHIRLYRNEGSPLLEVVDPVSLRPVGRTPDLLDESGRGLGIVAMVAEDCGFKMLERGKVVWARLGCI